MSHARTCGLKEGTQSMFSFSRLSRIFCLCGILAVAALMIPSTAAAQGDEDAYRDNSDISKMFHKLGRGVSNVLLGWVEIPKNVAREWHRTEPFTGTIVGVIKGFGWGIARTIAGFYEVISFPFPIPRDYQPIMYPEFVMPSVWGERLPIYQDEFLASSANSTAAYSNVSGEPTYGDSYATGLSRSY